MSNLRRSIAVCLSAATLMACEPSTKNININTKTRLYAYARVMNLLSGSVVAGDAGFTGVSTYIAVQNDIPAAFTAFNPPGVTPFQATAVGPWTAWLSAAQSPVASSPAQMATQGERFTVVETSSPTALQWNAEVAPTIPSGQVAVRFVNGAPGASNPTVAIGTTSLTVSTTLGAISAWQFIAPSAATMTITSGTAKNFALPALTAGQLHTYALTQDSTGALSLMDILETLNGDGASSAPIPPS